MEINFGNLLNDGLDAIALDLNSLKQEQSNPISEHARFAHFLIVRDNLDDIPDRKIELKELMENGFLTDFAKAFSLATSNTTCDDQNINAIAKKIKSVVNNGYMHKDMPNIKMDIGISSAINDSFF